MTNLHVLNTQSHSLWKIEQGGLSAGHLNEGETLGSVILNGSICQVLSTQMPVKQTRQIIKALPFALEEQLANEIDQNHIHFIGREGTQAHALVCDTQVMDTLISKYDPDKVLFLPLLLPQIEQGICVCIIEGVASIRYSKFGVISVTADIVTLMLDKLKHHEKTIVEFYDVDGDNNLLPLEIENMGYEVQQPKIDTLITYIEKSAISYPWNLLSGPYTKKKAPVKTKHSKLRTPLAIAASLIVTIFFIQLIQMKQYEQMTELVKEASKSFYVTLFPGENVRSIRRQFKDKLEEAGAGPISSAGFISILAAATKDIKSTANIEWDAVRFTRQKNELEINLIVDNIAQLDSVKQKMTDSGLLVDIASATNTGKRIKGVLKVSKNG
ncbi:MAG: general secretion pathway protein L [Bermanella sp.]|jgi:general secretion pathway protein L